MLKRLPKDEEYSRYNDIYPSRFLYRNLKGFWAEVAKFVRGDKKNSRVVLTRDFPGYSIGPHTDSKKDFAAFIFYLTDQEIDGLGTSMFVPRHAVKFPEKHNDFAGFSLLKTVPYAPNSYFGFFRSDHSFHGVTKTRFVRNTLQWVVNE